MAGARKSLAAVAGRILLPACIAFGMSVPVLAAPQNRVQALQLDSVAKYLMEPNGVAPRDVDMLPPGAKPDPFRLTRVEAVLRNPFRLDAVTTEILSRTGSDTASPASQSLPVFPDSLWPLLDMEPGSLGSGGLGAGSDFDAEGALKLIQDGLREEVWGLTDVEKAILFNETSSLFLQNEEDTALSPVEGEWKRLEEDARLHRVMQLAEKLHWPGLTRAAGSAWRLQTWLIQSLRAGGDVQTQALARLRKAALARAVSFHQGGPGADRVRADKGIWVDTGGDDEYLLDSSLAPGAFRMIVDLSGNDTYRSEDSLHLSAGNLGIDLIADLNGDDRYLGRNFAFGSALFGYSQVFDAAGRDYYEGRCAGLGFAFFGVGVLQDESGNDVYSASLLAQGASSTKGLGLLLDRGGDDRYLARPAFLDDLRYNDHYIHMVQGFSTGQAPDFGGGIGLLWDRRGNDVYLADIFAQGSAYWYALGLLVDGSGDDRYEAHQYAQGAGVHIAVGVLSDAAGDDHYDSKGVSQGCGHDYGFGLLFDRAGDDAYLATDMSQGAGSANGLGILQDSRGADLYRSVNPGMTLGHADMRRDRGSFGFFFDGGGKDGYPPIRQDGKAWRVFDGKTKGNGIGLDR